MHAPRLPLPSRLPAAVAFVWPDRPTDERLLEAASRHQLQLSREGVWARLPTPGDGAILDAAVAFSSECVGWYGGRAVIVPARAHLGGNAPVLVEEPFLEALERATSSPGVSTGVLLTGRAAAALDEPWALVQAGKLALDPRHSTPLWKLESDQTPPAPSPRNRTLPFRYPFVTRPEVELIAQAHRGLVVGPLGSGKTRATLEAFPALGRVSVLLRPTPRSPGLASLLAAALGQRRGDPLSDLLRGLEVAAPTSILIDGMEHALEQDLETIAGLLAPRATCPVTLAGRPGAWSRALGPPWERIEVGMLDPTTTEQLARAISTAAGLPRPLQIAFRLASAGSPWALEEGLVELLHRRELTSRVGAPFFAGGGDGSWHPSARLAGHVLAEAGRSNRDDQNIMLLVAALGDTGARANHLEEAASTLGFEVVHGWHQRLLDNGLTRAVETAWGPGVAAHSPNIADALLDTLKAEGRAAVREAIGIVLAGSSRNSEGAWQSWRLLAGTSEGPSALLAALGDRRQEHPGADVVAALESELAAHRRRQGTDRVELDLLWALLPRLRGLGRLAEHRTDLKRALELATTADQRIALLALQGELARDEGRLGQAIEIFRPALELAMRESPKRVPTIALELLGILVRHGDLDAARQLGEGLRSLLEAGGPSAALASCCFQLGNLELQLGHHDTALAEHESGRAIRQQLGLAAPTGASLTALGTTHLRRGDLRSALAAYTAAEVILGEHGEGFDLSWALLGRGRVLGRLGRHVEAGPPLKRALELRIPHRDGLAAAIARTALGWNELALGRLDQAETLAREALFTLTLAEQSKERAEAERLLGRIALTRRRYPEARGHLVEALRLGVGSQGQALAPALGDLLEVALQSEAPTEEIHDLLTRLARRLIATPIPEARERLDYLLYLGGRQLERRGRELETDPSIPLQRAWEELVRTTGFLAPEDRGTFLLRVADNARIVEAATREGVATSPGVALA